MKPVFSILFVCLFLWLVPAATAQDEVTTAVNDARASGVQESILNQVLVLGYRHSLKSDEIVDLVLLTKHARDQEFPVDQVVGKMEEGLSKRVRVKAVQQAVQQEMARYSTARTIMQQTLNVRGMHQNELLQHHVARAANTLAMGLSAQDMKGFFDGAPSASVNDLVASLEFMAALNQANVSHKTAKEIAFSGLERGLFSKGAWDLAHLIGVAKAKSLDETDIKARALEVVKGEKTVVEAQKSLGLPNEDMARGPIVMGPADHGSSMRGGGTEGRGQDSGGAGHGAGGTGPGAPGAGGPGAGGGVGAGSGGGAGGGGGAGPGGAGGSGGGSR